jgi:hypothetical protein
VAHVSLAPVLALTGLGAFVLMAMRRSMDEGGQGQVSPSPAPNPWQPVTVPALVPSPIPADKAAIAALIAEEARAQGVQPLVALAFADAESTLDPSAQGDKDWAFRSGGALYRKNVLENPHLARNPYRNDPTLWRSYGLFQLLAPYHVLETEHPAVLLDPRVNARRGVKAVRNALIRSGGELYRARRTYAGCGPGSSCEQNQARLTQIDSRWAQFLRKWGIA